MHVVELSNPILISDLEVNLFCFSRTSSSKTIWPVEHSSTLPPCPKEISMQLLNAMKYLSMSMHLFMFSLQSAELNACVRMNHFGTIACYGHYCQQTIININQ